MDTLPASFEDHLNQARGGDGEAFRRIVTPFEPALKRLFLGAMGPHLRARVEWADLLQETYRRAWRDVNQLRGETELAFWKWLSAIARHAVQDQVRHHRVRPETVGVPENLPIDGRSPSAVLQVEEASDRLRRSIQSLGPQHREVIVLVFFKKLAVKEVARRLGLAPNTVSMRLSRALVSLKETLGNTDSFRLLDGSFSLNAD